MTTPTARTRRRGQRPRWPDEDTTRRRSRRRFLLALGVPAFGITFEITAISTNLPSLIGINLAVVGCLLRSMRLFGLRAAGEPNRLSSTTTRTNSARAHAAARP